MGRIVEVLNSIANLLPRFCNANLYSVHIIIPLLKGKYSQNGIFRALQTPVLILKHIKYKNYCPAPLQKKISVVLPDYKNKLCKI